GFHSPGRACVQLPALANRSRVYTGLPCTDAANSSSFRRCSQFNFVGTSTATMKISEYDDPNDACPVMQKGRLLASFGNFGSLPYPYPVFWRNVTGSLLKYFRQRERGWRRCSFFRCVFKIF